MSSARRQLPNRRPSESFEFDVAGLRYTCSVGRFEDGRIGEIFLSNHKSNSAADTNARDAAIAFSFAVQHGADPEKSAKHFLAIVAAEQRARWGARSI
jgi:ribonucleoside-diphosphate reductase alpha chain